MRRDSSRNSGEATLRRVTRSEANHDRICSGLRSDFPPNRIRRAARGRHAALGEKLHTCTGGSIPAVQKVLARLAQFGFINRDRVKNIFVSDPKGTSSDMCHLHLRTQMCDELPAAIPSQ
jgi:hypothetical protein